MYYIFIFCLLLFFKLKISGNPWKINFRIMWKNELELPKFKSEQVDKEMIDCPGTYLYY